MKKMKMMKMVVGLALCLGASRAWACDVYFSDGGTYNVDYTVMCYEDPDYPELAGFRVQGSTTVNFLDGGYVAATNEYSEYLHVDLSGHGILNVFGGTIEPFDGMDLFYYSQINVYGGQINKPVEFWGNSTGNIYGGSVSQLWVYYDGIVNIYGGEIPYMNARYGGTVNVYGIDFKVNGVEVPYGLIAAASGKLTGTLSTGEHISAKLVRYQEGTIRLWEQAPPSNVGPVIDGIYGPAEPMAVNTLVEATADFSDPDVDDTHTTTWDWGDVSTSGGVVDEDNQIAYGYHTYSAAGVYTVGLTVTDAADESATGTYEYVVIYDPSAGFVTGGGWINSPAGAYVLNPSLSGKATFGFVSKYKKGATVPTGNTEFQFKAGDLNFHSTNYDWLVVTGSDYARFKGAGDIDGLGSHKFMLWAGDGPDTFRIKLWTEDEAGVEDVVYDNGSDQPISGGNIVVHAK